MNIRTRSIRRLLLIRLALAGTLLSLLMGGLTYMHERQQLNQRMADRFQLSVEILKLETQRLLEAGMGSATALPVQQALNNLLGKMPRSDMGRVEFIILHDAQQRELARYTSTENPVAASLAESLMQRGLLFQAHSGEFAAPLGITDTPDIPISTIVFDRQGNLVAYLNGVFVISNDAVRELRAATIRTAEVSMSLVLITVLLIYPVIRQLTIKLSDLSLHLLDANIDTIKTLGSAIAKRDSDTDAHNFRVTVYAVKLAESFGLDDATLRTLIKGAFLHDVGKIGIRDDILLKPGRLDESEFSMMQKHVLHGLDIVRKAVWLQDAAEVVGNHHEKFDGSGYPQGLKGAAIPVSARIFAIVDVYDALTSQRPYKKPFSLEESLQILRQGAGSHFDPELISRFETMAPALFKQYADPSEAARQELGNIVARYFQSDLGDILQDRLIKK